MISIYEMFMYSISNYGEKTPRSTYEVVENKKWPIMKDSNLLIRDEGIKIFNSENIKAEK